MSDTINSGRTAALALVAQVERQAAGIGRSYADGDGPADRYSAFRDFTESLDQFHVFANLVEGKLGDIAADEREVQAQHLTEIRWRLMLMEIAAMQSFMTRFLASGKPWPLGSQAFLDRREARLDEIIAFQRESPPPYGLTPPDDSQIAEVRKQFTGQSGLSLPLDDFGAQDFAAGLAAFDQPDPEPVAERAAKAEPEWPVPELPTSRVAPRARATPESAAAQASRLKPKRRVTFRIEGDNMYLDSEASSVVNDACKQAQIGLDELAKQMGVSRSTLVLMLNGSDAIEKKPLNQLRVFVSRNGGLL